MRNTLRAALIIIAFLATPTAAWAGRGDSGPQGGPGWQVPDDDGDRGRGRGRGRGGDRFDEGPIVPLDGIIGSLAASYPGRYLDSQGPNARNGRVVYEILWLMPDGRKIVIVVDARTGQILRVRGMG